VSRNSLLLAGKSGKTLVSFNLFRKQVVVSQLNLPLTADLYVILINASCHAAIASCKSVSMHWPNIPCSCYEYDRLCSQLTQRFWPVWHRTTHTFNRTCVCVCVCVRYCCFCFL